MDIIKRMTALKLKRFQSTKVIELGSCAFRQPRAESHCRLIHGYRLLGKFWFESNELDDNNWVVDFGSLKLLKKMLEHQFDHTFCVDEEDPHLELFRELAEKDIVDIRVMKGGVGIERTAEWCLSAANDFLFDQNFINKPVCTKVEVWEHEKNSAVVELTSEIL